MDPVIQSSSNYSNLGETLKQLMPDVIQAAQQAQPTDQTQQPSQMILPEPVEITQRYGNYNPQDEVFSGGYARGTNLGAKHGTPVSLPPGSWQVVNLYDQGNSGGIGNGTNAGYGNAVLAQNLHTGERLHFTHLSKVGVKLGDQLNGGSQIGQVGDTGNTTAPHLNLEYYDPQGNIGDVLRSSYAPYIPVTGGSQ